MVVSNVVRLLKDGRAIRIISPSDHKYYNIVRKAEKVQSNSVRFVGGSWLYFKDIDVETNNGFKLKSLGDDTEVVVYEWVK